MAYTVLARKYRSKGFDDLIGQDHIARTIKRAIETRRIAHAYLFCGTRGTGKTSTARILAKALNCQKFDEPTPQPCGECESCKGISRGEDIDVQEIDAASNTGVDDVRAMIENSAYCPVRSRFKIFIIDEVHMLSTSAFNALLKTLEEPPAHVKFILATTEAEKILQTILSRCQRYDFRNIGTREIAAHLKVICAAEDIEAEEDALLLVAKAGAGSMRDSLSLLDRMLSAGEKKLTADMIEELLGLPKSQLMFELANAIGGGDVKSALEQSAKIINRGLSADGLINALVDHLRNLLIVRTCGADSELVEVPGLSLKDIEAQANRFDAVGLTQSITILEELRRTMRQTQAGRALFDATLVRLTLAEQFTPIEQLLGDVGQVRVDDGAGAVQKKTADGVKAGSTGRRDIDAGEESTATTRQPSEMGRRAIAEQSVTADPLKVNQANDEVQTIAPVAVETPFVTSVAAATTAPRVGAVVSPRADNQDGTPALAATSGMGAPSGSAAFSNGSAAPLVAAPQSLDFDSDGDDDLPRPGKVWDSTGPSLKEMLALEKARSAMEKSDSAGQENRRQRDPFENVEPLAESRDIGKAWSTFLDSVKEQFGIHGIVSNGRLADVKDGLAVVRFPVGSDSLIKMLDRNGKRDVICDNLSAALGEKVGLRFEIDPNVPEPARAVDKRTATRPERKEVPEVPQPAMAAPVPGVKITPELLEQMRADPLVGALMTNLGATPVKVE